MAPVFDEKTTAKASGIFAPVLLGEGMLPSVFSGQNLVFAMTFVVVVIMAATIIGLVKRLQMVTRRLQSAENLQKSEASLLREAQRLARVGSWVWNPDTDEVNWSEEMFRIYRRDPSRGPARYKEAEKLYPPEVWTHLDAAVKKTFSEGSPFELDCQYLREDGSTGWAVSRGEAVRDESGRFVLLRGTVQEITGRKLAEDGLRESENKFRTAFAKAAIGMAMTDMEGCFVEANDAYSSITGYGHEELLGMTFHVVIHPDDFASNIELLNRMTSGDLENFVVQNRYLRKNGTVVWVRKSVSLARDLGGRPWRIIALIEDITVRKRIEDEICLLNEVLEERVHQRTEELEAANKELEAFSYSVSHDLRAPLRAMDGFSKALLEDCGPSLPEDGKHYIAVIRKGAQNMGALIDDLLTFSRLSRLPLQKRSMDTNKLVRDVLSDLVHQQEGRQLELRVDDLPSCEGDPALMRQVWLNLLANALKYTRQRSPAVIEIGATAGDSECEYHIRDNGAGFDMRYASKLFGVFQRLHRSDEYEGTGVGLAIVQRVIHRHGGQIWADAQVNEGATFSFTLPRSSNLPLEKSYS